MRRDEFNHVIAAASEVSGERKIVVVGSQAIFGSVDKPPGSMLMSMEADLYPLGDPDKATEIDASLGDGSQFQSTYGYYAHGVGPETAKAPAGWVDRLVEVQIPPRVRQREGLIALCLEAHDLVLAKCVAGRDRDWDFARDALQARLVDLEQLMARVDRLPIDATGQRRVLRMLEGIASRLELGDAQ